MRRSFAAEIKGIVLAELRSCGSSKSLERERKVSKWDCDMEDSRRVLERIHFHSRDIASWNSLLLGYATCGDEEVALGHFSRLEASGCAPNRGSCVAALKACISLAAKEKGVVQANGKLVKVDALSRGIAIHSRVSQSGWESDVIVASTLMDMYAKCGYMTEASRIFSNMPGPDVISWSILIHGYAENTEGELALKFFSRMVAQGNEPSASTLVAALKACMAVAAKEEGKMIEGKMVKVESLRKGMAIHCQASKLGYYTHNFVSNSLVDMYSKCGSMVDAHRVFYCMPSHCVVSWTTLILGYVENGDGETALEVYACMRRVAACEPDARTFAAVLKACGSAVALTSSKALYAEISRAGFDKDAVLSNCLLDAFAKCGSLNVSKRLFDSLVIKDSVLWTTLIAGYSRHGEAQQVFRLFHGMQDESFVADSVTLLCVLTACSHAGFVKKGLDFFCAMESKYGVSPGFEHYHCVIDTLCRVDQLDAAVERIRTMPFKPTRVTWRTVLSACRKWKNVVLGKLAFENLLRLGASEFGDYMLMEQIYGGLGMWEEQDKVETMRIKAEVWKRPGEGRSWWTDDAGIVHRFSAGDRSHSQIGEILTKLGQMVRNMKEQGYVADVRSMVRNISDRKKEDALCGHSERLAIACALINTAPGTTIRIIKNLRTCDDCHKATALISRIEHRKIICRDTNRFHIFESGTCSCGDYW